MAQPLCEYFGECGGCLFQNADYAGQVENKRRQLANAIGCDDIRVFTDREYFYRTRVDMVFHPGGIGFRRKGAWYQTVDIRRCVIANERINELIAEVRDYFREVDYFHVRKNSGTYRYAVIRAPGLDSSISIVLNADSTRLLPARENITRFAGLTSAGHVAITYVPHNTDVSISQEYLAVKGGDVLTVEMLGKKFGFNVQGFFQNNDRMALRMQEYVSGLLAGYETRGSHLVDLYGGVGTFGIINAHLFRQVTVIESFPGAVESAKENVRANGVENVAVLELDAKRLKTVSLAGPLIVITEDRKSVV
jgi:tRNA/tmRNA/rRNA uracil-C5-methylase (TrmA/RlmC/RlmD family)